jgi:hypothetical protein
VEKRARVLDHLVLGIAGWMDNEWMRRISFKSMAVGMENGGGIRLDIVMMEKRVWFHVAGCA